MFSCILHSPHFFTTIQGLLTFEIFTGPQGGLYLGLLKLGGSSPASKRTQKVTKVVVGTRAVHWTRVFVVVGSVLLFCRCNGCNNCKYVFTQVQMFRFAWTLANLILQVDMCRDDIQWSLPFFSNCVKVSGNDEWLKGIFFSMLSSVLFGNSANPNRQKWSIQILTILTRASLLLNPKVPRGPSPRPGGHTSGFAGSLGILGNGLIEMKRVIFFCRFDLWTHFDLVRHLAPVQKKKQRCKRKHGRLYIFISFRLVWFL